MVTYVLAAEAIAVIPIGRHLWLLLTKEITGDRDTTNVVATGKMVDNLDSKVGITLDQNDLWTQRLGIQPWLAFCVNLTIGNFLLKNSFPQLTPLNLMRIQAGACWIWKKNQNSRCRKFKIVNNNSKKCQIWFKIIPQTVLYFHPIPLISNSF